MYKGQGLMLGALGCLAIGIGGGTAVADSPREAYIVEKLLPDAGQPLSKILQTSRGLPVAGIPPVPAVAGKPATEQRRVDVRPTPSTPAHREGPQTTGAPAHRNVALDTIEFEFGSAELRPASIETLRDLGNALNSEKLKDQKLFLIEGHTDAVGTREYNMALSGRRAEAVKQYLVHEMGVSPDRLQTVGKGFSEPATKNPYAAQNRRVVVANLGA